MLLGDAKDVRVGDVKAKAVYVGETKVWPLGFSPASVPGLAVWYDADDASTFSLDITAVTEWRDKSGVGNHARQPYTGYKPERVASGAHSLVRFDGQRMLWGSGWGQGISCPPFGSTFKFTIMAVFRSFGRVTVGYESFPLTITAANQPCPFDGYNAVVYVPGLSIGTNRSVQEATTLQQWTLDVSASAATSAGGGQLRQRQFVNGVQLGSDFLAGGWGGEWTAGQVFTLGTRGDQYTRFEGELAEALAFDRVLADAERLALEDYLRAKWL